MILSVPEGEIPRLLSDGGNVAIIFRLLLELCVELNLKNEISQFNSIRIKNERLPGSSDCIKIALLSVSDKTGLIGIRILRLYPILI